MSRSRPGDACWQDNGVVIFAASTPASSEGALTNLSRPSHSASARLITVTVETTARIAKPRSSIGVRIQLG
jgi:hypothetical protein